MPILHDGHVIGAVGVSGASSADEDHELAGIGVGAVTSAAPSGGREARFFPGSAVRAMFATGGLLHETPGYKVDAGRRTAPGEAELHEHVVDVMHVVEGTATVVTGGEIVEPREIAPGELRGRALDGGTTVELEPGDVLVVPEGVPHQFNSVSAPFLYLVVKVEA